MARIKINGGISETFNSERGTRQGCPLSSIALAIRSADDIKGFDRVHGQDKIALYADNIIFWGDTDNSLKNRMNMIYEFGEFAGLRLNWGKFAFL